MACLDKRIPRIINRRCFRLTTFKRKKIMGTHAKIFTQPSMTQQHQKDECDVNNIMKRYVKTGIIDHINQHKPFYGEVSALTYHESMNQIITANNMFQELPSQVRKKFHNSPEEFLEYVSDPENVSNLVDLGLAERSPGTTHSPGKTSDHETTKSEPPSGSTDKSKPPASKDAKKESQKDS
ncbi:internal scaffolding protein [Microviridae sp.]|nr:internal scaffolding protein [Microviridae sp.]